LLAKRKVDAMSLLQLIILGVASMFGLASLRIARVHFGREPHPESRLLFIVAFILLPPIAIGALTQPATNQLRGVAWLPLYGAIVVALAIVMWVAALVAGFVAPGRSRPLLLLALVGSQGDPEDVPFDPPVTAALAESTVRVDRANAIFPRGPEFPAEINRAGFRNAWDALDDATGTLEGRILEDRGLGLAVNSGATAIATDARSRLDTLRRLALDHGQVWAS
jgi:hypothetical protein